MKIWRLCILQIYHLPPFSIPSTLLFSTLFLRNFVYAYIINFKGTVSVISSGFLCQDGIARFERYLSKLCVINCELDIHDFVSSNCFFICGFSAKVNFAFNACEKQWRNSKKSTVLESENDIFSHRWSDI